MTFDEFYDSAVRVPSIRDALHGQVDKDTLPEGPGIVFGGLYWIEEIGKNSYRTHIGNEEPVGMPIELAWQLYPLAYSLDNIQTELVEAGYSLWHSGGNIWLMTRDFSSALTFVAAAQEHHLPTDGDCEFFLRADDNLYTQSEAFNEPVPLCGEQAKTLRSAEAHFLNLANANRIRKDSADSELLPGIEAALHIATDALQTIAGMSAEAEAAATAKNALERMQEPPNG